MFKYCDFVIYFFFQCPCAENNRQEVARREKAATEIEIQKKLAKRSEKEKEKAKRDDMIQKRKKKYYESLKRAEAGKYKLHTPGLHAKQPAPNGSCIPCCYFKSTNSKLMDSCNASYVKPGEEEEEEEEEQDEASSEEASSQKRVHEAREEKEERKINSKINVEAFGGINFWAT